MSKKSLDAPIQSTKQMLDELDALMERMLTLPVNDLENAPPLPIESATAPSHVEPPPPKVEKLPPLAPITPANKPPRKSKLAQYLAESKVQEQGEASSPLPHARLNPPHRPMPALEPELADPEPESFNNDVTPTSLLTRLEPLLADIPDPRPKVTTHWVYRMLVGTNQFYDSTSSIFGGAGEWLRGPGGRALLGIAGVMLLAGSAGWLVKDLLGWHW